MIRLLCLGDGAFNQSKIKRTFFNASALSHFEKTHFHVVEKLQDVFLEIKELEFASCATSVFEYSQTVFFHAPFLVACSPVYPSPQAGTVTCPLMIDRLKQRVRKPRYLCIGKDRPVPANELRADLAVTAVGGSAAHASLKGQVNLAARITFS